VKVFETAVNHGAIGFQAMLFVKAGQSKIGKGSQSQKCGAQHRLVKLQIVGNQHIAL
jgi:hypothetical protein